MDVPGEQMLVDGINTGLTALRDGYNQGAEALSGTLPEALADGITSGGDQVLAGATMLSEAFTGAIEGGGEGGGGLPTPPGGGADPAEALQAALMDGAAQLQEALGGAGGGGDPTEALQAALMDGAAQLQEALGGAGGGGNGGAGTAGAASADVSVSGDARMGLASSNGGDTYAFSSRARVRFSLSAEADSGLKFAAQLRNRSQVFAGLGLA